MDEERQRNIDEEREHIKKVLLEKDQLSEKRKVSKARMASDLKSKLDQQKKERNEREMQERYTYRTEALNYFPFSKNLKKDINNRISDSDI